MHTHTLCHTDVGIVDNLRVDAYHDGIRISWDSYDFADNQGMSYHLQVAAGSGDFKLIFRGSATKFTWKEDLEYNVPYKLVDCVRGECHSCLMMGVLRVINKESQIFIIACES